MKQFDVCRNIGKSRAAAPYLLVIQSDWFDRSNRRVVVPLLASKPPASAYDPTAMPPIMVGDSSFYLDMLGVFSIPLDRLGDPVASAKSEQDAVIKALDWLIHPGPSMLG